MNKKIFRIACFSIMSLIFLFSILPVFADTTDRCAPDANKIKNLQIKDWPKAPIGDYTLDANSNLSQLVGYFFGWGVGLGGLAVFIALIIAGVEYITSIADPGKLKDAKDRIKSALIGLVLLLSSWAIFNLINPDLTNLTNPPKLSNDNGAISFLNTECTDRNGCCLMDDPKCDPGALAPGQKCPQVNNPSCNPKYWACCQSNDKACLAKGEPVTARGNGEYCASATDCISSFCQNDPVDPTKNKCASGPKGAGDDCTSNSDCSCLSKDNCNYCKSETSKCAPRGAIGALCDRDADCADGKCQCDTVAWQKKCVANAKICNMTFDQPEIGCDVVRFYEKPDFGGKSVDFKATWIGYSTSAGTTNSFSSATDLQINNGDWQIWKNTFPAGFANIPQSYQAFAYQKDGNDRIILDNSGNPMLLPCGEMGCGCSIARCITVDSSGTCIENTADKNSGRFVEYAYGTNTPVYGVKVKDPTKQNALEKGLDLGGDLIGIGYNLACSILGVGCN